MAKITYSPIKQDAEGNSFSDLILTGDTFYDDAIVTLADGERASLYVNATTPNRATLVFDSVITGNVAVSLSADVFDSGELPTGVDATLSAAATVPGDNGGTTTGGNSGDDTTAPDAPTIDDVAGDNIIDDKERADGVTISGTAEANSTVTLTFVDQSALDQANTDLENASQALTDAQTALDNATTAATDAQTALDEAQAIVDAATTPTEAETTAVTDAQTALDDATTAATEAKTALGDATTAVADAETAVTDAVDTAAIAINKVTTNAEGKWSYDLTESDYPVGSNILTVNVVASDEAGNESDATPIKIELLADATAPVIKITAETDSVISGTVDDLKATVTLTIGSNDRVATVTEDGSWSYTLVGDDYPVGSTTLTVNVVASDEAGNKSEPKSIEIETTATIKYSTTELTEATVNDGSVTEAVTLTLAGDTFYSELAGADLNDPASDFYLGDVVTGVPAGLTAHLIVSTDLTSAELTFDGKATLNEEADSATLDLSPVQVSLPSSYFESNIAAVNADQDLSIMFQDAAILTAEGSFVESAKNNSTVTGKVTITLQNSSFTADLIGTDLNAADVDGNPGTYVENVPAGLTAHLRIIDATSAELTLTGTADSSNHADSINDLTYSFQATDFETGILPENSELLTTDVAFIEPRLAWDETSINDGEHDGFAEQTATFKLVDGAKFVKANLNLSKFVKDVPEGVTVTLIADSETEATLTVNGAPANFDVATLTLALPKLAFVGRMDVAGRDSGIELTFDVPPDTTAPDAPTFNDVAVDGIIDDQERAEGVTISGKAEPGSTITLTFATGETSASSGAEIVDPAALEQANTDLAAARETLATDEAALLAAKDPAQNGVKDAEDSAATALTDAQTALTDAQKVLVDDTKADPTATDIIAADKSAITDAETALADAKDPAKNGVKDAQDSAASTIADAQATVDTDTQAVKDAETAVTDAGGTVETTVIDEPVVPVDAVPVTTTSGGDVMTTTGDAITVDADGNWSYPLAETDYPADYKALIVTAVASDAAGNVSAAASVTINLADTTPPVIELTPSETDGVISGTVDDLTATVTLTVGGNEIPTDVVDGAWSYTLGADDYSAVEFVDYAATATLPVTVSAKDALGNESDVLTYEFTVKDTTAPDAVSVALKTDSGTDNADNVTKDGSLTVTGAEPHATVEYSLDDKTWSATQPTLVQGENTVLVRQTDLAGNVSDNADFSFVFDTEAKPVTVAISGIDATHSVTASATLTVTDLESAAAVIEYSTDSTDGKDGKWSSTEPTFVDGKNAGYVRQTDEAGNISVGTKYDFTLSTGPTQVAVSAANATPFDASKVANIFNVAEGDYTYNITGFGDDDAVYFPAANTPSVKNTDFTDGNVDLQYANNGKVALIHLSGLTPAQDAALYSAKAFNTLFGADTIGIVGVTTPTTTIPTTPVVTPTPTTGGAASTLAVKAAGNGDAVTGNVQFDLTAGDYTYTIANFSNGDVLKFPAGQTPTVKNSDFTDGSVDVQYASNGTVTHVILTGLTAATDSAIYSANSFISAFGAGSII